MKYKIIMAMIFVAGFGISNILNAQKDEVKPLEIKTEAIVYLIGGTQFKAEILEWELGSHVIVNTNFAENLRIEAQQIEKIVEIDALKRKPLKTYDFKEKGFYQTARMHWVMGNFGSRAGGSNGIGFSYSAGQRLNRLIGVGGGLSYDQYVWNSGEDILSFFAEINGFFTPTLTSLCYNVQVGYGMAFTSDRFLITEAQGGISIYPTIGVRFGTGKIKYIIDAGYKFQNANFTYENPWGWNRTSEQDITYRRMTLRVGLTF